jgi:D-lactate dehydrogenase (quinone)
VPADAGSLVIVEVDGDARTVDAEAAVVREALKASEPIEIRTAEALKDRTELWKLRKSLSPAIAKIAPLKFNEDVCVPLSRIPELCGFVERLGRERLVTVVTFGHAGDGNLHVNFMTDHHRPDEVARVKESVGDLFREVVRLGGTLSGEHGIGMAKRPYLPLALDAPTLAYMQRIKRAFDPAGVLNPGKVFPDGHGQRPS